MAGTSVDPPSIPLPGGDEVSPEDLQTIRSLYHTCPQLWDEFGNISCFLGLLKENYQAYKVLYLHLARMDIYFDNHLSDGKEDALLVFAVAAGFVERSVQSSRQIMRDMGKAYITELPPFSGVDIGFDMLCLHQLRSLYMTCSARSSRFRLRLAQTGFLEDLMEDIKHIKHLSGDTLDRGNVYQISLGTIHNCLRHPDVIPTVKQMNIVPHVAPFLDKRSQVVKALALTTLSYIVDETQLDLLRLDSEMLQFFLSKVQGSLAEGTAVNAQCVASEVIRGLSNLAKNDFNKRLMVSQGAVNTLVSVLGSSRKRPYEEKRCAVTLFTRLVTDPLNRQVCRRDGQLRTVLKALTKSPIAKEVKDLLTLLEKHDAQRSREISPEDLQTICKLYQKCPKLWADFRNIISFLDLLTENPQAYKQLYQHLVRMGSYIAGIFVSDYEEDDLALFAVSVGFVERTVHFSRQIMREMGKTYNTEFPPFSRVDAGFDMLCLHRLREQFLNCTSLSSLFCLRLAQTGFLEDLVEDVKHIKHQSAEALDEGNVFVLSLGTIHNCLRHPDVIPIVKRMDIVHHITPFLEKKSKEQMVKAVALMTLSYFVDESQLDLLRLDAQMLQFFLDHIQAALRSRKFGYAGWMISEVIRGLSNLAKYDFNKRLIVSQGALNTMVSVLGPSHERPDEEKRCTVTLLTRLVTDPLNRQVCQRDGQLMTVLKALTKSPIAKEVKDVLTLLEQHDAQSDFTATSPHLAEVLADQVNMLTILGMGQVEFVLDQLTSLTAEGGNSGGDVTRVKVLQALTELAGDEGCRREIMARGGLGAVREILQMGQTEEQTQAAKVVLELVSCEINRVIVKNDDALMASLREFTNCTCPELQQVAENVLQALNS